MDRLIDADDLWHKTFICEEPGDFRKAIENAPCIDAIKIPRKIGDRVWAIRSFKGIKHPQDGIVGEMFFTKDMKLHILVKYVARGEWGKTVFATCEEAQAAIDERSKVT